MDGILRISKAASIALHAMALLATSPSRRFTVNEIAGHLNSSSAHLSKVCQRLARLGLLKVIRGPRGGYRLAKDPVELTLKDIYEAIDGPMLPSPCLLDEQVCKGERCVMGPLLQNITESLVEYFSKTTLDEAVASFYAKGKKIE